MTLNGLPLHPVLVHLPLGLAILMPLFAIVGVALIHRGLLNRQVWFAVTALQVLLVASGIAAIKSGESEEDAVGKVLHREAIEQHEDKADGFVAAAAIVALLAGSVPLIRTPRGRTSMMVTVAVGTVIVTGLALRTGHAGGELVYRHGATNAYVTEKE